MSLLHDPRVKRRHADYLLCEVPAAGPRFALTFDDGPSARNTGRLLDVLERHRSRHLLHARRVLARPVPGAIVILHDASAVGDPNRGPTIAAVDEILSEAARRGLEAVTVQEMTGFRSARSG